MTLPSAAPSSNTNSAPSSDPNSAITSPSASPSIVFIGAGNMASALMGGLIARGMPAGQITAIDPSPTQRAQVASQHGVRSQATVDAAVLGNAVVVLAVKPQQMREAVDAIAPLLGDQLVLSVAAGVRASDLSRWLNGHQRIVRTMPNTPALVGLGATGLAALAGTPDADRNQAEAIMGAVGCTVWVSDESLLDAVTALSGSGPAYVFRFIECLIEGGQGLGLNAEQARTLALQTVLGAAQLAASSDEPVSVLRERVTSKGGTTAAALAVFESGHWPALVARAMAAAEQRSGELGDSFAGA
jgi:pyrroline-5-carboxylate reductase